MRSFANRKDRWAHRPDVADLGSQSGRNLSMDLSMNSVSLVPL